MERLYKESVIRLNISATTTPTAQTNVTFWSYDIDTARQTFEVMKNDEPISLVNASDITLVLQFAGLDNIIHLTPEIEDPENGIISIVLPTQALGFEGEVTGGLFIKFENEQSFDCGYFVFNLRTSSIDHDVGDLANFYVQRFEDLKKWVEEKVETILKDLENDIKDVVGEWEVKELERQANEATRKQNEIQRESQELVRTNNEDLRKEREEVRQDNESKRQSQEETRNSSEELREEQEEVRQQSENERKANEEGRKENELERQSQEETRNSSEELREEQEEVRQQNENERKANEEGRKENELERQSQEETRNSSEKLREEQEEVRQQQLEKIIDATGKANESAQFAIEQGVFARDKGELAETKANEAHELLLSGKTLINEIEEWYESIKDKLSDDVALYLLNLITNHKNETVTDVAGAHGLRVYADKIQILEGDDWVNVDIGTTSANEIFITDGRSVEEVLGNKAELAHTHGIEDIENLQSTLDEKSLLNHSHTIDNIENLENTLNSKVGVTDFNTHKNNNVVHVTEEEREKWNNLPDSGVTSVNTKTGDVTLSASDVGAAPTNHSHTIDNIGNLQTTLDGKAPVGHVHSADDLTSGTISYDRLKNATTTQQGITQLNDTLTSESTFQALTANQGKVLNDNKLNKTENAVSASKLQMARKINDVEFDGTNDITLKADPNAHTHQISEVTNLQTTLDGKAPISHTHSAEEITSGTISVSHLPSGSVDVMGIVRLHDALESASPTRALTANQGKVLNENKLDKTANAVSATKLQTARTINGVAFDGTQNITITASGTPSAHTHPISDVTNLQTTLDGKAPTSHASTGTTYGRSTASNYGHAKASATTPVVAGTASVGTDNGEYARGNHVHPAQTTITGNAGSATKLQTARTINGVAFDGTQNITISATLPPIDSGQWTDMSISDGVDGYCRYYRDSDNFVHIRFMAREPSQYGGALAILPEGVRPPFDIVCPTWGYFSEFGDDAISWMGIRADGYIALHGMYNYIDRNDWRGSLEFYTFYRPK